MCLCRHRCHLLRYLEDDPDAAHALAHSNYFQFLIAGLIGGSIAQSS